jgi:F-type H+-transporting ATPase subunit b
MIIRLMAALLLLAAGGGAFEVRLAAAQVQAPASESPSTIPPEPTSPDQGTSAAEVAEDVEHGVAHEEGHQEGAAMPQLDHRTFPSQIFWLAVSFALLYWLLSRKALPRLADILETRQERIAADLDRAARARAEAEEALESYERLLAEAHGKAADQVRQAQERVGADISARQAALDAELATRLHDAERRIEEGRQAVMGQLSAVAAEAAQAAVQRLAGLRISLEEARAAVDRVSAEVR